MTDLVLRSGEHEYWDYPRALSLTGVFPGPGGRRYARASIAALRVPDLALSRRDGTDWRDLAEGERVPVAVWQVPDPQAAWAGGEFRPPTPNPAAWCTVVANDLEDEMAAYRATVEQ